MTSHTQDMALLNSRQPSHCHIDWFDLICIPALLLSFIVVSFLPAAPSKFGDIYFHQEAQTLARAIRGAGPWHDVGFARAPGPVLYYAVPYSFLAANSPEKAYWQAAVAWNAFAMAVAVLLIRRTGELLMNATAGKVAAALCLIAPFAVYYSFGVASEAPAYLAATIFSYGWARWRAEGIPCFASLGVALALAGLIGLILCRLNTLVVLGIAAVCGLAIWLYRSRRVGADTKFAAFCVVGGLATVLLVSASLKRLPATRGVGEQASNFSDVVFFGSFQFRTEPWDWRFWGKGTRQGSVDYQNWLDTRQKLIEESARTKEAVPRLEMRWSVNDIVHHPIKRLQMFAIRTLALNIWIVNSVDPNAFHIGAFGGRPAYFLFHIVLNGIALLLVFASIWFLAVNRTDFLADWPLWGIWGGLLLFHAFTYAEPRYLLPGLPGLAIMAGCALSSKFNRGAKLAAINRA
jgi:hypothetical protein